MESKERIVLIQVERILSQRLAEFAKAGQTGMITIDVQLSNGQPTAINTSVKDNRKVG